MDNAKPAWMCEHEFEGGYSVKTGSNIWVCAKCRAWTTVKPVSRAAPQSAPVVAQPAPDDAKDAERYRWLRGNWFAMGTMANRLTSPGCHYSAVARAGDVETLDAAIDAARKPGSAE